MHPAPTMSPPCSTSSPTGSIRSVVEADDEVAKSFRRGARPSAPVRRPLRGGLLNDAADSARTLRRRVETVLDSPASKQSCSNFLQVFGSYLGATHQRFVAGRERETHEYAMRINVGSPPARAKVPVDWCYNKAPTSRRQTLLQHLMMQFP